MDALGAEQVLDAERYAFQRAALAAGELRVGRLRHGARLVGGHRDIGIERRVGAFDRREIGVGQFGRGYLLAAQFLASFRNRQSGQVGHVGITFRHTACGRLWQGTEQAGTG